MLRGVDPAPRTRHRQDLSPDSRSSPFRRYGSHGGVGPAPRGHPAPAERLEGGRRARRVRDLRLVRHREGRTGARTRVPRHRGARGRAQALLGVRRSRDADHGDRLPDPVPARRGPGVRHLETELHRVGRLLGVGGERHVRRRALHLRRAARRADAARRRRRTRRLVEDPRARALRQGVPRRPPRGAAADARDHHVVRRGRARRLLAREERAGEPTGGRRRGGARHRQAVRRAHACGRRRHVAPLTDPFASLPSGSARRFQPVR